MGPASSTNDGNIAHIGGPGSLGGDVRCTLSCSRSSRFVVRSFVARRKCSSSASDFSVSNRLGFISFSYRQFSQRTGGPCAPTTCD